MEGEGGGGGGAAFQTQKQARPKRRKYNVTIETGAKDEKFPANLKCAEFSKGKSVSWNCEFRKKMLDGKSGEGISELLSKFNREIVFLLKSKIVENTSNSGSAIQKIMFRDQWLSGSFEC